jgi:three-Cys-motif partner protein
VRDGQYSRSARKNGGESNLMSACPIASDGLIAREVGRWAEDKFYYLKRACFIFSRGMKWKWSNRCFIDLFAGPGKSIIRGTRKEINGSPFVALACEEPFTDHYFVDADVNSIEALKERVRRHYPNACARYWTADCNVAVRETVQEIPNNALSLAFIDPTSVQIRMSTIVRLAAYHKVDLLINFPQHMAIQRIKNLKWSENDLNEYFGSPDWKRVLEHARACGKNEGLALRGFYKERLEQSLGYKASGFFGDKVIRSDRGLPLYYLIYASRHERGIDFWQKITVINHTGQKDMVGPIDE